ncbi:DUF3945 domain-containing protein [Myroides sp. LJL119]
MSQSFEFINPELSHTILVQCKKTSEILVIKNIDENGLLQGVEPIMDNLLHFIKVHHNHDRFLPFFSLLLFRMQKPHQYIYYRVPITSVVVAAQEIRQTINPYSFDDDCDFTLQEQENGYKKATKKTLKKQTDMSSNPIPTSIKQQETDTLNTSLELNSDQKSDQQNNSSNNQTTYPNNTFLESQIDWDALEKIGISKEKLQAKNLLEPLLKGYKTYTLFSVKLQFGNISCKTDARISFRHDSAGRVIINLQGIKREPLLHLPFYGHEFSAEDKSNLLKYGNMGRVVDLLQVHTGELLPSLISIDKATNDLVAMPLDRVKIPDYIKGIKLSEQEKLDLKHGKKVYIKDLQSKKGEPFNAFLQYNTDKKYVEFFFDKPYDSSSNFSAKTGVPTKFRGVELTLDQQEALENGQSVFLDNLIDRNGCQYKGYIMYNQITHALQFFFEQPASTID